MNRKEFLSLDETHIVNMNGVVIRSAYSNIKKKRTYEDKTLKARVGTNGYSIACYSGACKFMHRIIAEKFIPNPANKSEVNHINGIKTDFRIENLEWVTRTENQIHSWDKLNRKATWQSKTGFDFHDSKRRAVNKFDVDGNFITQYGSLRFAAHAHGWHRYTVQWIIDKKGGYWKGCYWTYAN